MSTLKPILKYPGSKWKLANWVVSHFPEHKHYVEPYCGSAAVFFAKQPVEHEVLNDRLGAIVNLFKVMREQGDQLAHALYFTPWSEQEYNDLALKNYDDENESELERARRFLIRSWQGHGSKLSENCGWRHNGLHGDVYPARLWQKVPDRILAAMDRLRHAEIRNRPALEIIQYYNSPDCLLYVDPPYVLSTRSRKYYAYEMTDQDHCELLEALDAHTGAVVLSGYAHPLYDDWLKHWHRVTMPTVGEHGKQQIEVLWLNQRAGQAQQLQLELA